MSWHAVLPRTPSGLGFVCAGAGRGDVQRVSNLVSCHSRTSLLEYFTQGVITGVVTFI